MCIFKLLFLFFCWQVIVSKESTLFTGELKRLYDRLKQKEHALVKNIKKKYPNIYNNSWKNYHMLGNKAFNAIKKSDSFMPACDALDQFDFDNWDADALKDFLTAYAKCSLEQSGIDPQKVPVFYCMPDDKVSSPNNKRETAIYFKDNACLIDFYEDNGTKKKDVSYKPELHIESINYGNEDDLTFQLVMINKAVASLVTSSAIKQAVLRHFVLSYYGVEPLFKKLLVKEWGDNNLYYGDLEQKIHAVFDENALLLSLLKNPELIDYVCNTLENRDEQTSEIKKMLKFLYKIKKLKLL